MNAAPLKTSETWLALVAAILQALVGSGVLDDAHAQMAQTLALAILPLIAQTIFRKVRAGQTPFVHPTPSASNPTLPASPEPGGK